MSQIEEQEKSCPVHEDYSERITQLHKLIELIADNDIQAKDKNTFLKSIIDHIDMEVDDYGRNKGGKPVLDIYLR